ncbi:MerR family transcriptional regulator [Rhodocyclus tenuis]|uniref:MerR family transcriptional regulator n=1 Tax=Rhodocyclus tenuis TaxID=1066 RepID=UPI0019082E1A|nr:MerR family transcriptional regulator [Rhodocyclus tenuis]MBK1679026.1 MerR family transcriptional regulator [Rhodocyclus tenuis]
MTHTEIVVGVVLDEAALTLEELARACAVDARWVVEHVEAGILGDGSLGVSHWHFSSNDLTRARCLRQLERAFAAEPELAALVADLQAEIRSLRQQLRAAGFSESRSG